MTVEHHDLVHEFPELRERIHELKISDHHFRRLFDEYHDLTREVENIENEVTPASTQAEEELKIKRVHLKDELYRILTANK
ncbi:MAG: GTP-binding protein [Gammaproteobacteria bacterium]|nr:MAG: GTP-binding protein [Gammaproteobacteria bacterium]